MSKGKKAGIIVGCVVAIVIVVVILTQASVLPPFGPGFLPVSGSYILTEASTSSDGWFQGWDIGKLYVDLENDGTFYLRLTDEGVSYLGEWKLNGNNIRLQVEIWGSPMVWTGTVSGDTISLGDGSIWKKGKLSANFKSASRISVDYEVTADSMYPYLTVRVEGTEEKYGVSVRNPTGKPLQLAGTWFDELTSSYVTTVKFYMHAGVSESGLQKDPIPGEYHITVMSYQTDEKFECNPVFEGPDVSITNVHFEGDNFKYLGGITVVAQVYNGGDLPVYVGHMRLLVGGVETDHDMRGRDCLLPGATTAIEGRFLLGFLEHGTYPVTVEIYSYREAAYYSERVKLASYETQVSG